MITCFFLGVLCDDGDDMTINDVVSDECNCEGDPIVNGCTTTLLATMTPVQMLMMVLAPLQR